MGTPLRPSQLHQDGATTGQVPTWDGSKWTPETPSSSPGGAAGGDLAGTYPNPTLDLTKAHVWTAEQKAPDFAVSGLTGATNPTRYVGGTTTGHPTAGTFAVGDYVVTADGHIWVCTAAGSPGTWVDVNGSGGGGVTVEDEGTSLGTATTINLTGAGVTTSLASGVATVSVPGGGSSLSAPIQKIRTAGDVTISSTTPVAVDTALDITLTAEAGDMLEVGANMLVNGSSACFICVDVATVVSGAVVNYVGAGSSTPGNGLSGWIVPADSAFRGMSNTAVYVVQAGDISGGNTVLRLVAHVNSSSRVVRGNTTDRLFFRARNLTR